MRKTVLSLLVASCVVFAATARSQTGLPDLNMGFEKISDTAKLPDGWGPMGSGYSAKADPDEKRSGRVSLRIEPGPAGNASFGAVAYSIPASYEGREVELRGFLKLQDVADGFAGLWLRIDGDGGSLQFDNMQSRNIAGTSGWTAYSVKLPLPAEGQAIVFGALLTGKGKIWVDDLELLIDGKELKDAKTRPVVVFKAASDKEFDNGSMISTIPLTKSHVADLALLAKVWGFLKYYHPAVARGDHNWDYELFRVLPKVATARSRKERDAALTTWIDALGPVETAEPQNLAAEKVKLAPDLSWMNRKQLGDDLADRLEKIRDAKRDGKNYYIGLVPNIGNPQFKNEQAYRSMSFPDTGFRLLALFRYWNVIQYFFPNRHLVDSKWDDVLVQFIPRFVEARDELEYKKSALALIGSIHDTHANIWGQDATLDKFRGLNYAPVGVTFVEDQAVVTTILNKELAEPSELRIGDVIERINGQKVSDIVKQRLDLSPASNYPTKLRDIAMNLLRTNETELKIVYTRDSERKETKLECFGPDKLKVSRSALFAKDLPPLKMLQPDVAYLYPGSLKQGQMVSLLPEIAKTKGLIVDLRSYPSEFIVFSLGSFLVPKPINFVKFSRGSIERPGLFTYRDELAVGENNPDYYKGKVVILINEVTQSQAEYTTMALRTAPRATVIGSTTAGADGNVSQFYLPGGISTMISGIGVYYPDGKETQRVGIVPDIVVKPTIKGIKEGRDEVLEKALEMINAN
jgi:C-terminal processing protease CtpA/Prc